MPWFRLKFYIMLSKFILFPEVSTDSFTLRRCCSGTEVSLLDASPEFIFSDVLVFTSRSSKFSFNYDLPSMYLGDLSSHQTALSTHKSESHDLQRFKYSSMVLYGLDINDNDGVNQIEKLRLKEATNGVMKSTVILLSSHELIEVPPGMMSFMKSFDISQKCYMVNPRNWSTITWSSIEGYQDIRGNLRQNRIQVTPYALTVPDSSVPFNFNNITIRATAVDSVEEATVVRYKENGDFTDSLGVLGLWGLRDTLNFSIAAMKAETSLEPESFSDGKVVGIARQLLENEADISILHSYHITEIVKHLKPLSALGEDQVYAIFRQPPSFTVHNVFTKPFHRSVWIVLFFLWTVIFLLLLAFLQIAFRYRTEPSVGDWEPSLALLWSVCALCQRSFFCLPEPNSLRVLLVYGGSLYLILYLIYSAEIISYLTATFPPINSIDELVANKFDSISDPNMFFSYLVKDDSISQEKLRSKLTKSYTSDAQSFRQVAEEWNVYHLNTLDTLALCAKELNYSDKDVCNWYSHAPLGSVRIKSGFFIKRHSALQEPFNLKLVGLMERGLNHRYIKSYYEITLVKCPKVQKIYREDLGLSDVVTAFGVLAIGNIVALIFFICEHVRHESKFSHIRNLCA